MSEDPTEVYRRILPDGRLISVNAMTFGKYRLHVGPSDAPFYDDGW